jgi:vacuolar-type H+-ATPase subunit I/STV1
MTGGCSPHSIGENKLLAIVRQDVKAQLERIEMDEVWAAAEIGRRVSGLEVGNIKRDISCVTDRLSKLESYLAQLYEDKMAGNINAETFKNLSASAEAEMKEKQGQFEKLSAQLKELSKTEAGVERWISAVRKFITMEESDRETLQALIDRIEVSEAEGVGKSRTQNVKIFYRFAGNIRQ